MQIILATVALNLFGNSTFVGHLAIKPLTGDHWSIALRQFLEVDYRWLVWHFWSRTASHITSLSHIPASTCHV